MIGLECVG